MIRLTRRERLLAAALAAFAVAWSLFAFAIKPALERINTLNRVIAQKHDELVKLRAASKEYVFLRDNLEDLRTKITSQQKSFELLPFLESLVHQSMLEGNLVTMKQRVLPLEPDYSETIVEIELENLTLGRLVDFLYKVESSDVLARTKMLHIRKNRTNKDLLDSVVEIHNAKLSQSRLARN